MLEIVFLKGICNPFVGDHRFKQVDIAYRGIRFYIKAVIGTEGKAFF